jgi:hypothetical protein
MTKRRKIFSNTLFCSVALCTASGAFAQSAYVTSFDEPGRTIAPFPDYTTILSLHNLPTGSYLINAKLNVSAQVRFSAWIVTCWISSSTERLDLAESPYVADLVTKETQSLPLHAFVVLSAPDTISLACQMSLLFVLPELAPAAHFGRLSAIQVGELHVE